MALPIVGAIIKAAGSAMVKAKTAQFLAKGSEILAKNGINPKLYEKFLRLNKKEFVKAGKENKKLNAFQENVKPFKDAYKGMVKKYKAARKKLSLKNYVGEKLADAGEKWFVDNVENGSGEVRALYDKFMEYKNEIDNMKDILIENINDVLGLKDTEFALEVKGRDDPLAIPLFDESDKEIMEMVSDEDITNINYMRDAARAGDNWYKEGESTAWDLRVEQLVNELFDGDFEQYRRARRKDSLVQKSKDDMYLMKNKFKKHLKKVVL